MGGHSAPIEACYRPTGTYADVLEAAVDVMTHVESNLGVEILASVAKFYGMDHTTVGTHATSCVSPGSADLIYVDDVVQSMILDLAVDIPLVSAGQAETRLGQHGTILFAEPVRDLTPRWDKNLGVTLEAEVWIVGISWSYGHIAGPEHRKSDLATRLAGVDPLLGDGLIISPIATVKHILAEATSTEITASEMMAENGGSPLAFMMPTIRRADTWHEDRELSAPGTGVRLEVDHPAHLANFLIRLFMSCAIWMKTFVEPDGDSTPKPQRSSRRRFARALGDEPSNLRYLRLRQLRHEDVARDASYVGSGREYSHRWIVGPFWRNQPYGPASAYRRLQLVPPFVKGPPDKPIVYKSRVIKVDR